MRLVKYFSVPLIIFNILGNNAQSSEGSCQGIESSKGIYQYSKDTSTCAQNYHDKVMEIRASKVPQKNWGNFIPGISVRYRSSYDLIPLSPLPEDPQCSDISGAIFLDFENGSSYLFKSDSIVKTPYENWSRDENGCYESFNKIWSPNTKDKTFTAKPFYTENDICSIKVYKDRSLAIARVLVENTSNMTDKLNIGDFSLMTEFKSAMSLREKMINDGACKASAKPICSIEKFEFTPRGSFKTSIASVKIDSAFLNSYNYTGYDDGFEYSNAETIITLVENNFCETEKNQLKTCSFESGKIKIEGASFFSKSYSEEEARILINKMQVLGICK